MEQVGVNFFFSKGNRNLFKIREKILKIGMSWGFFQICFFEIFNLLKAIIKMFHKKIINKF